MFRLIINLIMKVLCFLLMLRLSLGQLQYSQVSVCSSVSGTQGDQTYIQVPVCANVESNQPPQVIAQDSGCPGINFDFPRDNQVTDYVRYRSYFPALNEATICFWVNTSNHTQDFTGIFSYAVRRSNNEILIGLDNNGLLIFFVKGNRFDFNIAQLSEAQSLNAHVCGWFSAHTRQIALYVNAVRRGFLSYRFGSTLGGGDLILGQDQDETNARRLDANQSYRGSIANVLVWPRILSDNEIRGIAKDCTCPLDYSVSMTMDRVELQGSVRYQMEPECRKI